MYFVYVLQSEINQSLYIGYTEDVFRRLTEHNEGKSKFTSSFIPYKLIFYEAFISQKDAKSRETYLKSGWGFRSIKKILKNYLPVGK
ncbi:MAG TPA: GIY-YIG nuclease family protein [Candidatus Paceibacterota bacterium]|nr:GIY-YIG nuclease family protein [Candidatus Paceibacterota bacterium]